MGQLPLFDFRPNWRDRLDNAKFDGETYEETKDKKRLTSQLDLTRRCMSDGRWRTLREIIDEIGKGSEAGISARLRDLRKPKFGAHTVERRRRKEQGLFEYRLLIRNRYDPNWGKEAGG